MKKRIFINALYGTMAAVAAMVPYPVAATTRMSRRVETMGRIR